MQKQIALKALAFLLSLLTFHGLFFNTNGLFTVPFPSTIGMFILLVVAHTVLWLLFWNEKRPYKNHSLVVSAFVVFTAFTSLWRTNILDQFILFILSMVGSFISWYLYSLTKKTDGSLSEFFAIPFLLGKQWITSLSKISGSIFNDKPKLKFDKKLDPKALVQIGIGLIVAIPVLIVLSMLFSSADPVFEKLISQVFNINIKISSQLFDRVFFSAILLCFLFPLIKFSFDRQFKSPFWDKRIANLTIAASIVLGSLALLMAVFIIIQFQYLFATMGDGALKTYGITTYSEYVRRGFGELMMASFIVYATTALGLIIHRSSPKYTSLIKYLNYTLLIEISLLIASILRRVYLYQTFHGLTQARVYGAAILILLLILTVIIFLRHSAKRRYFLYEVGITLSFLFLLANISVDKFIVSTKPPTVNNQTDYVYISGLGPDGFDGWVESYKFTKNEFEYIHTVNDPKEFNRKIIYAEIVLRNLKNKYHYYQRVYDKDKQIARYNLSEINAYERLKKEIPQGELDSLYEKVYQLYSKVPTENFYESLDRDISPVVF